MDPCTIATGAPTGSANHIGLDVPGNAPVRLMLFWPTTTAAPFVTVAPLA
jgi:hypothetical protein